MVQLSLLQNPSRALRCWADSNCPIVGSNAIGVASRSTLIWNAVPDLVLVRAMPTD
jgi:hypothetical protein